MTAFGLSFMGGTFGLHCLTIKSIPEGVRLSSTVLVRWLSRSCCRSVFSIMWTCVQAARQTPGGVTSAGTWLPLIHLSPRWGRDGTYKQRHAVGGSFSHHRVCRCCIITLFPRIEQAAICSVRFASLVYWMLCYSYDDVDFAIKSSLILFDDYVVLSFWLHHNENFKKVTNISLILQLTIVLHRRYLVGWHFVLWTRCFFLVCSVLDLSVGLGCRRPCLVRMPFFYYMYWSFLLSIYKWWGIFKHFWGSFIYYIILGILYLLISDFVFIYYYFIVWEMETCPPMKTFASKHVEMSLLYPRFCVCISLCNFRFIFDVLLNHIFMFLLNNTFVYLYYTAVSTHPWLGLFGALFFLLS